MATVDAAVGRAWRAVADVRRRATGAGSSSSALRSLASPDRRRVDEWLLETSRHHERYRSVHRPASERAAVVCVSMRPHLLDRVAANVERQRVDVDVELVFVGCHPDFAGVDLDGRFRAIGGATVLCPGPGTSLGAALNLALDATGERFVAKFDDDDWYGHGYLSDALRAHGYAGAGVVGKHTYYADIAETGKRYLRFPGHEFSYSGTLAGGTLVVDRERIGDLRFDDISLGEDRAFLAGCHRRGVSTFSADRFGFVQHRGSGNTWTISTDDFLVGSVPVDPLRPEHCIDRPESDGRGGVE